VSIDCIIAERDAPELLIREHCVISRPGLADETAQQVTLEARKKGLESRVKAVLMQPRPKMSLEIPRLRHVMMDLRRCKWQRL
jgi:hypothetical protein